ncbi:MAG: copper amine oxidase N-terminal domain-containing protein [Cellulosilyticum sp.]|nr:copper amine oxidase N-terminal domain-containing protein [Cellulosilyticum sp.]
MKLRQKLAVVMAAAMVVTAVPVVTSAATTNSMSMSSVSIVKDGAIGFDLTQAGGRTTASMTAAKELNLHVQAKGVQNIGASGQTFFVEIENATFSDEAYYAASKGYSSVTVDKNGDVLGITGNTDNVKNPTVTITETAYTMTIQKTSTTELMVTVVPVSGTTLADGEVLEIPVYAVAKSGEVSLKINGTDSFVTSTSQVIGTASDKKVVVTEASTLPSISEEGGTVGDIIITEAIKGAIVSSIDAGNKELTIKLPTSSDLEFGSTANIKLVGTKGFAGVDVAATATATGQELVIDLSNIKTLVSGQTAVGQLAIQGIEVLPEGKTAAKGDVNVTVEHKDITTTTVKVATVADENVTLACAEPVELVAGKEAQKVEFVLTENTKEAITDGRKVDFTIENGFIDVRHIDTTATTTTYKSALDTFKALVTSGDIELPNQVAVTDIVAVEANSEGQITGFTVQFNNLKASTASKLEFAMPVMADINTTGEIKLTVEGRAIQNTVETVLATVKAPYTVEAEAVELKVGLNGQVGGKLTITETAAEMLEKGTVTIQMDEYAGITFKKGQDLNITAENLKIKNTKVYADSIEFEVERTSDEAGKVVIEGIEFNVDRTAPEGSFDLTISGDAISTNKYIKSGLEKLVVADFVTIGTKNTEDLGTGANGLKAGTASFTIDSNKYTVNGVEKEMDGKAYASNGRTMVPVRYVSEAFGIEGNNILFNKGVVTLMAGNRIVQLTVGSNVAVINGVSFAMDEKVTVKDGRTYIPMGEIGRLLNVNVTWDNATKTATFKN